MRKIMVVLMVLVIAVVVLMTSGCMGAGAGKACGDAANLLSF